MADRPTGFATVGMVIALAKKMALRYGVVNITDIQLDAVSHGIKFILADGSSVTVPFDASELPFSDSTGFLTENNVQDAILQLRAASVLMRTSEQMEQDLTHDILPEGTLVICKQFGVYQLGGLYQLDIVGDSRVWSELSSGVKFDEETIEENNEGELQAIGVKDSYGNLITGDDIAAKSVVSVSNTGSAIDEINYITINGVEKKIASGSTGVVIDNESITENTDGEIQAVALKNKGLRVTSTAIVYGNFDGITYFDSDEDFLLFVQQGYIEKGGIRINYDSSGLYMTPGTTGGIIIALTGTSGTLTDDQFNRLNVSPVSSALILNNRVYRYNQKLENAYSFTNISYPTTTTKEEKAIYVNFVSTALNYKSWSLENQESALFGELYDIGSEQVTLEDEKIYPKMTVAQAKEIRDKYKAPNLIRLKWTISSIEFIFEPFNFIDALNGFMVNVHGKNIKFEWQGTDQDEDFITPTIVNGGKYEHLINVVNGTTPYGTWNYQFKFLDDDNELYTSLADVGTYLYDAYGTAKLLASGSYVDSNSQTYLVISVRGTSNNMVEIEYVKLSDGIISTTTSGLLAVTDSVH